jgi:hypothetical protein
VAIPPNRFQQFDRNDLIAVFRSCDANLQAVERSIAVAEDNLERLNRSIKAHRRWLGYHFFLSIFSILFVPITEGRSLLVLLGDALLLWNELNELFADREEMSQLKRTARSLRAETQELKDELEAIEREFEARDGDVPRIPRDHIKKP